jgi:hypothetical protein
MYVGSSNLIAALVNGGITNSSQVATAGTWYHAALVGTINVSIAWLIYINGVLNTTTAATNNATDGAGVKIGGDNFSQPFPGQLADTAFWKVQLTALEIAGLAQGMRPSTVRPASLIAYYPIDGLQSPEPDLGGGAFNLTVTGTTAAFGPPLAPFTPRWPQMLAVAAAPTFNPAWAKGRNTVVEGVAT